MKLTYVLLGSLFGAVAGPCVVYIVSFSAHESDCMRGLVASVQGAVYGFPVGVILFAVLGYILAARRERAIAAAPNERSRKEDDSQSEQAGTVVRWTRSRG
jgi:hypothetical protein